MSSPGTLRFGQVAVTPSPPPVGYDLIYVKTDDVLYIQDSFGVEVALGSSTAITSLTGEVTATGPGTAVATVSNSAVIGKVLTGFTPGPNSTVLSTDTILQAFQKLQAQATTVANAITNLTGDVSATGPGSVSATIQPNVVDNTKLAQMPADTLKGNNTGITANALDLTTTQVTAMLNPFVGDSGSGGVQGLVPAPAAGDTAAAKFLSADGTFEIFPVSGELVSFFTGTASDIGGYLTMQSAPPGGSEVYVTDNAPTTGAIIQSFATPPFNPSIFFIPNGVVSVSIHAFKTGGTKNVQLFAELYKRDISSVETLLATTNNSVILTTIETNLTSMTTIIPDTILNSTDRIVVKFHEFISGSGSNPSSITIGFAGMTTARAGAPGTTVPAITALTGDVTATGPGNVAATIPANTVTNAKAAQMPANTLKGNNTGSTANASDLTIPQVVTMFGGTPVTQTPDQSNSPGTDDSFARADHIHNIPSAVPVQIGTTNIQGSAASFALSDHVHNHGNQTVGTLHAVATTTVNGFMSATDKVKLNTFSAVPGTNTQILISDGTNLNPETVSGDLSNTNAGVFTVNSVGGSSAANIHSAELAANAATSANTPNTIVKRDGSGNFSAGTITASLNGNATNVTGVVAIANGGTNNSSTYTAGSIIYSDGTKLTQDNANFFWNDTNQSVGIGVIPASGTFIDAVNTSGSPKRLVFTGYGVGSTVGFRNRFARGTSGTPSAVNSGDTLGFISGQGYGTSQFPAASTGAANFIAGETFTNTSNQTYFTVNTTPTGSVTSTENFRVASTGLTLGPQSSSTSIHQVNGGLYRTTRTITGNLTIDTTTTDDIIFCNQSGAINITLPAPVNGRTLVIKDISGTANTNNITLVRHASEKIEGLAASRLLETNWGCWVITTNGTDWFILG